MSNHRRATNSRPKNEVVWEKIFDELDVLKVIEEHGRFNIEAETIKSFGREPRLAAKFDHCDQLPAIFRKNKLAILPTARGSYTIGRFRVYELPSIESAGKTKYRSVTFPHHIKSLNYNDITSETEALSCAHVSGILSDFLADNDLTPTVRGRMGSGEFSFLIQSTRSDKLDIRVRNAQIEVDAGFETPSSLVLIEAKNDPPYDDFIVRQLYYPFRLWHDRIGTIKQVRNIFMTYANDTFSLYEYVFKSPGEYNSLELIQAAKYKIGAEKITIKDIARLLDTTAIQDEPDEVTFPQADSLDRVVSLCKLLLQHRELDKFTIAKYFTFDSRQGDYYANAACYLGLAEKKSRASQTFSLTEAGRSLLSMPQKERTLELMRRIIRQGPFRATLESYMSRGGRFPDRDEIVRYMKASKVQRINITTMRRRASTVRSWVKWVLEQTEY